jgi:hypothetical protein
MSRTGTAVLRQAVLLQDAGQDVEDRRQQDDGRHLQHDARTTGTFTE